MEIAQTILAQLGGNRFAAMTGAKLSSQLIEEIDQVHVEDLRRIFTDRTGLETSLGVA